MDNTLLMSLDSKRPECPSMSLLTAYATPDLSYLDQPCLLLSHVAILGSLLALHAPRLPVRQSRDW